MAGLGAAPGKSGRRVPGLGAALHGKALRSASNSWLPSLHNTGELLFAPRAVESHGLGVKPLKTVGAQFSVLRRTYSVSELCIISLHANK